jgi:predicted short-subunit dehydrogenase-like oxidoreductase (DUF2520 family)
MPVSDLSRRLGFVGAGRVGKGLSLALSRAGYEVVGVSSRSGPLSAQQVADRADIVFVTVPDDRIASVAENLAWKPGQAAVHCSGAAELSVLEAAAPGRRGRRLPSAADVRRSGSGGAGAFALRDCRRGARRT